MISETDKIWTDRTIFYNTAKKVGLKDHACETICFGVDFPGMDALYFSSRKSIWNSFREAFTFFFIRSLFILEGWIEPDQKISEQKQWGADCYDWIYEIDIMNDIVCGNKITNIVSPHKVKAADVKVWTEEWFRACNANERDIAVMAGMIQQASLISLNEESYVYDRLFFGETENDYMFIQLILWE